MFKTIFLTGFENNMNAEKGSVTWALAYAVGPVSEKTHEHMSSYTTKIERK